MGVGKTTVCQILKHKLENSVFLDGDWCWDASPFVVSDETKSMVLDNISHLLNNFLGCSAYQNVIFCWVMHEQSIIDDIVSRLNPGNYTAKCVSLVCSADCLRKRLQKDIDAGIREPDIIQRSAARLELYDSIDSVKVDVSEMSAEQAAEFIANM